MLAILPFLAFLVLYRWLRHRDPQRDPRHIILRSAILWGAFLLVSTEILSAFEAITPGWLAFTWGLPVVGLGLGWGFRPRSGRIGWWPRMNVRRDPLSFIMVGILSILILTALVAWLTPPQTWDSLNYHMSRVAHWAQEGSVKPFATGIEAQNSRPPWAEYAILHLYQLAGGDRLASFVAWFAVLGCVVGVSYITALLGGDRFAQTLSSLFTVTLPMAIVQASGTMNDAVVAFWVLCAAVETLHAWRDPTVIQVPAFTGLAAGLAVATKPIAFAYLAPIALAWVFILWRKAKGKWAVQVLGVGLLSLFLLNAGYAARNVRVYGGPYNPYELRLHGGMPRTPRVILSNLLRNASLHAGTPSPHINKGIALVVMTLHGWMGQEVNDPRTTSAGRFKVDEPNTHEDLAGNALHAYLLVGLVVFAMTQRQRITQLQWSYLAGVLLTFLAFSALFKWQIFGSRYHLPFFVLAAPFAGLTLRLSRPPILSPLALLLWLGSLPWLLGLNSRPLIPHDEAYVGSVLAESRDHLLFANGLYLEDTYRTLVSTTQTARCKRVGLMLSGNGAEYPLWYLMDAPRKDLEMEWIVADTPSEVFEQEGFQPCAVLCEGCPDGWEEVRGLPLAVQRSGFQLFLRDDGG